MPSLEKAVRRDRVIASEGARITARGEPIRPGAAKHFAAVAANLDEQRGILQEQKDRDRQDFESLVGFRGISDFLRSLSLQQN
jgi:hypothetical protein